MSEEHSEDHNPIKTPTQFMYTVLLSFVLPIFVIIGLVYYVSSDNKTAAGSDLNDSSVQSRI